MVNLFSQPCVRILFVSLALGKLFRTLVRLNIVDQPPPALNPVSAAAGKDVFMGLAREVLEKWERYMAYSFLIRSKMDNARVVDLRNIRNGGLK